MEEFPLKTNQKEIKNKDKIHSLQIPLQVIRGLPMSSKFKKETVEEIFDFMPADDDVIIVSYPKTGTTWTQCIVHQILTKGESYPSFNDLLTKVVPFLEVSGVSVVEEMMTRPRVYKHHLPFNMVKKNAKAKMIYVYRKPEDTLVSFYHFLRHMNVLLDFDEYFENFLSGNVPYGRYFEHVLSYLEYKDDCNMLLISYEKLQINRKEEILRIAKFLGEKYYNVLVNDEPLLDSIIEHTSFDYMKKNLSLKIPSDPKNAFKKEDPSKDIPKIEVNFFRKGVIGDGKTLLKDHQLKRLNELANVTMQGTEVLLEWLQE